MTEKTITKKVQEAITWLQIYSLVSLFGSVCGFLCMGAVLVLPFVTNIAKQDRDFSDPGMQLFYVIIIGFAALFILLTAIFQLLVLVNASKPKRWVYFLGIVSIVIGLTSLLTMIPGIVALIKLMDQEAKDYYLGRS